MGCWKNAKQRYGYSRIVDTEDEEEEMKHRKAQFLIRKILEKADEQNTRRKRKRCWWFRGAKKKFFKIKIKKIGRRIIIGKLLRFPFRNHPSSSIPVLPNRRSLIF
ncbi:hypothetical protein M569_14102 [Genlisea aurea]|uniref:Uncharacterized protein n=1 Tax=Genlisea aurea TaxID=192259 RepID=S8C1Q2_9LAMI|nr:hypothetical protein M569_14102 [Genlisea aurea]